MWFRWDHSPPDRAKWLEVECVVSEIQPQHAGPASLLRFFPGLDVTPVLGARVWWRGVMAGDSSLLTTVGQVMPRQEA